MRQMLFFVACVTLTILAADVSADSTGWLQADGPQLHAGPSHFTESPAPAAPGSSPQAASSIPPAKAKEILEAVQKRHGDPPPGYVGGRIFQNRERKLPPGHYLEYDVNPKRPGQNRGPERLVIEQGTGKAYYTGDHYVTFIPLN